MKPDHSPSILVIEDEAGLAQALVAACGQMGYRGRTSPNARAGLEQARTLADTLRLVVLDIGLPDRSGLELLAPLRNLLPAVPVLIITAHGNLENAVAARRQGAAEYLVKPLDLSAFEQAVHSLLRQTPDHTTPAAADTLSMLTGSSPAMQPVFKGIATAAASAAPVLLRGPSGSGKSLAARVIHTHSARAGGPFITLSCGGLSANALEDQLFGTGEAAPGLLAGADGGTLLLDEVSDLSPDAQARLLRFVEDRSYLRRGENAPRHSDVRILSATQRDPAAEVGAGRFRKDLYFRLNVIEIVLPALRQRMEDVPSLVRDLLARLAPGRSLQLSPEALARLRSHDWPGHVRELRNVLEHAAAQCTGVVLLPSHFPPALRSGPDTATIDRRLDNALGAWTAARLKQADLRYDTLHGELEGRLLAALLPHFDHRPTRLASALHMNRNTLRKRLGRDHTAAEPES